MWLRSRRLDAHVRPYIHSSHRGAGRERRQLQLTSSLEMENGWKLSLIIYWKEMILYRLHISSFSEGPTTITQPSSSQLPTVKKHEISPHHPDIPQHHPIPSLQHQHTHPHISPSQFSSHLPSPPHSSTPSTSILKPSSMRQDRTKQDKTRQDKTS